MVWLKSQFYLIIIFFKVSCVVILYSNDAAPTKILFFYSNNATPAKIFIHASNKGNKHSHQVKKNSPIIYNDAIFSHGAHIQYKYTFWRTKSKVETNATPCFIQYIEIRILASLSQYIYTSIHI